VHYLVMPLPVSIVMNKLGYRNAVLCGLVTYGVGAMLFWPAAAVHQYHAFLAYYSSCVRDRLSGDVRHGDDRGIGTQS